MAVAEIIEDPKVVQGAAKVAKKSEKLTKTVKKAGHEIVDVAKASEDLAEHVGYEVVEEVVREVKANPGKFLAIGAGVGLVVGAGIGYQVAVRRLLKKFNGMYEEELDQLRERFKRKQDTLQMEKEMLEESHGIPTKPALEELVKEHGYASPEPPPPPVTMTVPPKDVRVFDVADEIPAWDQEAEEKKRQSKPGDVPYVISHEEMETTREQYGTSVTVLTYYEVDDVLASDDDTVLDQDDYVDSINLARFGEGSNDPNCVYIVNPEKQAIFEVYKIAQSYAQVVHGFDPPDDEGLQHSDRRPRWDDDPQ